MCRTALIIVNNSKMGRPCESDFIITKGWQKYTESPRINKTATQKELEANNFLKGHRDFCKLKKKEGDNRGVGLYNRYYTVLHEQPRES